MNLAAIGQLSEAIYKTRMKSVILFAAFLAAFIGLFSNQETDGTMIFLEWIVTWFALVFWLGIFKWFFGLPWRLYCKLSNRRPEPEWDEMERHIASESYDSSDDSYTETEEPRVTTKNNRGVSKPLVSGCEIWRYYGASSTKMFERSSQGSAVRDAQAACNRGPVGAAWSVIDKRTGATIWSGNKSKQ